jgi:hypothetical protein
MIHPDHFFKDTLHNHETPLGAGASFQGVMKKREKKRRAFFWFSLNSILVLLLSLSAAAIWDPSDVTANEASVGNSEIQKPSQKNRVINAEEVAVVAGEEAEMASAAQTETPDNSPGFNRSGSHSNPTHKESQGFIISGHVTSTVAKGLEVLPEFTEPLAEVVLENEVSKTINEGQNNTDWMSLLKGRGIASEYIFQIQPTEGTVLPEFVPFYPYRKPKFNPIFELNVTTAGNGYKYFRESQDITVAGNHRFSQYHGIMLFDLGRGVNVGGGVGYLENVGIGKALISEWSADTNIAPVRTTKAENIAYRMNKLSLPLGIRYQLGFGRGIVRISATAMPGIITLANGKIFSRDAIQSLDNLQKNNVFFDARLGAGLYYQVAPKTAISAEPMMQYQSIAGNQWKSYRRFGFGFGLGVIFKP